MVFTDTPLPEIRINFDALGLTRVANSGFEIDTTGWLVSAGIQSAATSITRTVSAPYMGLAVGRLVTTATNGSGCKFVMSSLFSSGVTYRFRVFLKSISGTTSALIRIGSLGTAGDRATATMVLTGSWAAYSVDFTPSGNRSDIQVNITNNAASIMTADIDDAEVYAVRDDVSGSIDRLTVVHGVNFEGGVTAGQATLTFRNDAQQFSSGAMAILPGLAALARVSYAGLTYGLFYGSTKRMAANVDLRKLDVILTDPVDAWGRSVELNAEASNESIAVHRLTAIGALYGVTVPSYASDALTAFEDEANVVWWGFDQTHLADALRSMDESTGTVGFIDYDPDPNRGYVYRTIARNARASQASVETISDTFSAIGWTLDDELNITDQRVNFTSWLPDPDAPLADTHVVEYPNVPFVVKSGTSRTIALSAGNPVIRASFEILDDGAGSTGAGWFWRTGEVDFAPGADQTVSSIIADGQQLLPQADTVAVAKAGVSTLRSFGADISADFVQSPAIAYGLADWHVNHLGSSPLPRLDLEVTNLFPTQVVRRLCDLISVSIPLVNPAPYSVLIRSIETTVDLGARQWKTTYGLEPSGIPIAGTAFVLNTTQLNSGSQLLGY
jgi:hypothetical protein